MTITDDAASIIDSDPLTESVRATWTDGDYGRIAAGFEKGAAAFVTRHGVACGEQVLDVCCGTGNVALPAACAGANVTALDIAPNLLQQLRWNAARESLWLSVDEGNCEALPYEDGRFDTVISMFGVMFAARPERAAAELGRVCRPGGRIIMANWTAEGFIGEMFRTIGPYVSAPSAAPSPLLWGAEDRVRELLGETSTLILSRRMMTLAYPLTCAGVVDLFRAFYGPTKRAFDQLAMDQQEKLHAQLTLLWSEHNRATDGTTRVESEYLEVTALKKWSLQSGR